MNYKTTCVGLLIFSTLISAIAQHTQTTLPHKKEHPTKRIIAPDQIPDPFQGFYASFAAGERNALTQLTQVITESSESRINTPLHAFSFTGELGIGYWYRLKHIFYLGVQPFIRLGDNDAKTTMNPSDDTAGGNPFPTKTSATQVLFKSLSGGIDIEPGLRIAPRALLFGIVGMDIQPAQLKTQFISQDAITGTTFNQVTANKNTVLIGWRLGLGISKMMSSRIALNFYYVYTNYGIGTLSATTQGNNLTTTNSSFKLSTNSYMVGINYFFTHPKTNRYALAINTEQWNGFFAGFNIGVLNTLYKNDTNTFYRLRLGVPSGGNKTSGSTFGNLNAQGALSAGYGHIINRFYLGIETSVNAANKNASNQIFEDQTREDGGTLENNSTNTKINMNSLDYTADIRAGLAIYQNTLLYLQGGLALGRAQLTLTQNYIFPDPLFSLINSQLETKKTLFGWQAGLGIQQMLRHNVALSLDYFFTDFGKLHINARVLSPNGQRIFISNATVNLNNETFMLGINKYFSS
jgi:opacity protein-like surface antigen